MPAAKRAVALDDTSAEAHASLAFCLFWGSWDVKAGTREFKRALELNPNYATAHHWYATALLTLGHANEALSEIERARELDSTSRAILADKGLILYYAGKTDQGMTLLQQIEAAEPSFMSPHTYLAEIYFVRRDCPDFLKEFEKAALLSNDPHALSIAAAAKESFSSGSRRMMESMLAVQEDLYLQGKEPAYLVARTALGLGKRDETLRYLQSSLAKREVWMLEAPGDLAFAELHSDPSWRALVARIGLPH